MALADFKDASHELHRFQGRLLVAGVVIVVCFGLLLARFAWLQVVQHQYYQTKAEDNRISVVPVVPNRGTDHGPQRRGAGAQLLGLHAGDQSAAGGQRRGHHQQPRRGARDPDQGPAALPQAAPGTQGRGQHPDQVAPHRRRSGALFRQRVPLPRRGDQGAAVPPVPDGRDRFARGRLHRPHQRRATSRASMPTASSATTRAATPSARPASRRATSASCTASPGRRRSRSTRAAAACARSPARRRSPARTSRSRSTSSCRRSPSARSATSAARWWRSIRSPAACWRWCRGRATTPTSSSKASIRRAGSS